MDNKFAYVIEELKKIKQRNWNISKSPEEVEFFYRQKYREEVLYDYIYRSIEYTIGTQYQNIIEEIKNNCSLQAQNMEMNDIPYAKEELNFLETLPRMSKSDFFSYFPNVSKLYNMDLYYELKNKKQILENAKKLVDRLLSDNKINEENSNNLKKAIDNINHKHGYIPSTEIDKNGNIISATSLYQISYYKVLCEDLKQNHGEELEKLKNLPGTVEIFNFINNIDNIIDETNYNYQIFRSNYTNIDSITLIKNYYNYVNAKSNLNNLEIKCNNYNKVANNENYISIRINDGWYYLTFSDLLIYGIIEQMLKNEDLHFHDLASENTNNLLSEAMNFKKLPDNIKEAISTQYYQLDLNKKKLIEKNYKNGNALTTHYELNNLYTQLGNPEVIMEITPEMLEGAVKDIPDFKLNNDYKNKKTF